MNFIYDVTKAVEAYRANNGFLPTAIGVPRKHSLGYPSSVQIAGVHIPVRRIHTLHPYKQNAFVMLRG